MLRYVVNRGTSCPHITTVLVATICLEAKWSFAREFNDNFRQWCVVKISFSTDKVSSWVFVITSCVTREPHQFTEMDELKSKHG